MPNLNQSYQWAVDTCNNPKVGYSSDANRRRGKKVNGITYYDCSSFISKALTVGGFFKKNPWFSTQSERSYLKKAGFKKVNIRGQWKKGDIVWRAGHTEMVYKGGDAGGITMGAHTNKYPLKDQVSISKYHATASSYSEIWRYGDGVPDDYDLKWVKGNRYLTQKEMENNAYIFYSVMYNYGYDFKSICAMLGNIQRESGINPGLWQSLKVDPSMGFGLVQWTPSTNYTNWAKKHGYENDDGYGQCKWIDEETASKQWIKTTAYPLTWEEFKKNSKHKSLDYLTMAFLKNFERAGVEKAEERKEYAKKWYKYLKGKQPFEPTGGEGGTDANSWWWYMYINPIFRG